MWLSNRRDHEARSAKRRERVQRAHAEHRATIDGLNAAVAWLNTQPTLTPGLSSTLLIEHGSDEQVRAFADRLGLLVEDNDDMATCRVVFGPVRVEIYGTAPAYKGTA